MGYERTHSFQKKSSHTPQPTSQFSSRPFEAPVQRKPQEQMTPDELENEAFNQNKFDAFGLQLKEKNGTITPVEQERLGVLQAKMDDFWAQRRERASRFGYDFSKVSFTPREGQAAPQLQPMWRQGTLGMPMKGQRSLFDSPQQSSLSPIQAKLTIGQPGDQYEQEADRVASQVVEQINAPASAQPTQGQSVQRQEEEKEEELQTKPEITPLQRQEEKLEELQAKSTLQRGEAIGGGEASTDLDTAINSARGGGQPLDADLQRSMGQAMGADFSGVKVHADAQSDKLNQSIQAKAFTTGQDVFFRQGAYDPGSRGGQELIAHELTHVVQQSEGIVSKSQSQKSENIPSLSSQMQNEAKIIQPLRYKTDNTQVDIKSLSFMRVLDYLKRNDPDIDPGGVFFDNGDKATLQARSDYLYPIAFQTIFNFLGQAGVQTQKTTRNIPASVNLQNILTNMRARHDAGNLPGFREWLASVEVNPNVDNVLDKINELRAAQNIVGPVNVDESQIPGTNQTADLEHGNEQTEVKTIRKPIEGYTDFTGQVTAALGKFTNVNPTDGKIYNATIYCSIKQDLLTGKTQIKKGMVNHTKIDPANLDKILTITRQSDGQQMKQTTENQLDKLLNNLNTQNWAGANQTHNIYIVLENGTPQHLVRHATNNTWARA